MGRTINISIAKSKFFPEMFTDEAVQKVILTFLNLKHICNFLRNSDLSDLRHFLADRSNRDQI